MVAVAATVLGVLGVGAIALLSDRDPLTIVIAVAVIVVGLVLVGWCRSERDHLDAEARHQAFVDRVRRRTGYYETTPNGWGKAAGRYFDPTGGNGGDGGDAAVYGIGNARGGDGGNGQWPGGGGGNSGAGWTYPPMSDGSSPDRA